MICHAYGIGPRALDGVTIPEWQAMLGLLEELAERSRRRR